MFCFCFLLLFLLDATVSLSGVVGVAPGESFSSKEMMKNDESVSREEKETFYPNCIWQQQKRKENQGSSDKCRLGCVSLSSLMVFDKNVFFSVTKDQNFDSR